MLTNSLISNSLPPSKLFVVTAKRVKAGKGILSIHPTAWFVAHGGIKCGVYAKDVLYPLDCCFINLETAFVATNDLVKSEQLLANQKMAKLSANLKAALKAANDAVLTAESKRIPVVTGMGVRLLRLQLCEESTAAD